MNGAAVSTRGMTGPTLVTRLRVRYPEVDGMGVVYHAHYLVWCDMGRTELIRSLGLSYADIEKGGLFLAVAEASVRYGASARYDDLIAVTTTLTEVRSRSLRFDYLIERDGELPRRLATATVRLVPMNRDGALRRLPDALLRIFRDGLAAKP